jgi:hypothetical protein
MRFRSGLLAAWMMGLLGCGDSSGPGSLEPEDFVGTWSVEIPAEAGCWDAFEIRFVVEADDAANEDPTHELINIVSTWYLTTSPEDRSLFSGNFNWGEDNFVFVFNLGGSTSLRMEGDGVDDESVTGTFHDRDGEVFPDGCSATVTATKL